MRHHLPYFCAAMGALPADKPATKRIPSSPQNALFITRAAAKSGVVG